MNPVCVHFVLKVLKSGIALISNSCAILKMKGLTEENAIRKIRHLV